MSRLRILALMLAFCGPSGPVTAEEMSTFLDRYSDEGDEYSAVGFDYESCGGECYVGTLICDEWGRITVELADLATSQAAEAMLRDSDQVLVSAGDLTVSYSLLVMRFTEMNGSWWVTAQPADEKAPQLARAISGARTILVQVSDERVTLPVDDNVRAWATACR